MTPLTALITGANRGIGLAIARELAEQGHRVLIGCRDLEAGQAVSDAMRLEAFDADAVHIDLDHPETIDQLADLEVDILVNNAGLMHSKSLLELTSTEIQVSLNAHLIGPLKLVQVLSPGMIERGYGRIVNVSTGWGSFREGLGGPEIYGITKAALNALTFRLAKELPEFIKVNAMCPGWVRTRMGGENAVRTPEQGADTAVWLATLPDDGPTGGFFRNRKPIGW